MKKIFFSVSFIFSLLAYSQVKTHTVQAQETVYGITHRYDITQEQLYKANPFLNERGLQIGDVLQIPGQADESQLPQQEIADHEDKEFYYRVVKPKQTLYSLSKEYGISQETIKSLNPFIEEKGLQVNDIVRIPKKVGDKVNVTEQVPACLLYTSPSPRD